jgi:hypothetical protein
MPEPHNPEGGNLANGTEVQEQLFSNLEQLHQPTMFITKAGLSIRQHRRRNFFFAFEGSLRHEDQCGL